MNLCLANECVELSTSPAVRARRAGRQKPEPACLGSVPALPLLADSGRPLPQASAFLSVKWGC